MLVLLSPAKTFNDKQTPPASLTYRAPHFVSQANKTAALLATYSFAQLQELLGISEALIQLNMQRYADWHTRPTAKHTKPAGYAFWGNVGRNLDMYSMSDKEVAYADEHLLFLSGLYGVCRPLDFIQEYRLEMGTALATDDYKNLYDLWQQPIADYLAKRVAKEKPAAIVNLASSEYSKAAAKYSKTKHAVPVIDIVFQEGKDGKYRTIGVIAKDSRGLFARWLVQQQVETIEGLKQFNVGGYQFAADVSTNKKFVFRRKQA